MTDRCWATPVGNLSSPERVLVDGHGRVIVGGWALEWWIGADDRWHLPPDEPTLRQRLISSAPMVESMLRVPSGEVVQRTYSARDGGSGEYVVAEVENLSPVPVAVAWVVALENPAGGEIDLQGTTVLVDGVPAVFFDRPPARSAASPDTGALTEMVVSGAAGLTWNGPVRGGPGGGAALVFALPHTAQLRAVVPMGAESAPSSLPAATAVAKGWEAHGARGMRLELPDHQLDAAVSATRRSLLLADTGTGSIWGEPPGAWADIAGVLRAWDRYGFHDESAAVLATLTEVMGERGYLGAATGRLDANGAALVALDDHIRLCGIEPDRRVTELVAAASMWIHQHDPRSFEPDEARWTWWGLAAAEDLLALAGERRAAADARSDRIRLEDAAPGLPAHGERRSDIGSAVDAGSGPGGPARWEMIRAMLASASPTWTWMEQPAATAVTAAGPTSGSGSTTAAGAHPDSGPAPAAGPTSGSGSTTATGPTAGTAPAPPLRRVDLRVAARLLRDVRSLLVAEVGAAPPAPRHRGAGNDPWELEMCRHWPQHWSRGSLEVHDAPTSIGTLSYAVRWHGERPALLWDLSVGDGLDAPIRLRIPGLDPAWETHQHRGEALLAPVSGTRGGASP